MENKKGRHAVGLFGIMYALRLVIDGGKVWLLCQCAESRIDNLHVGLGPGNGRAGFRMPDLGLQ